MNTEETIGFAMKAHGEQRYSTVPYIVHLMLVARHFRDENHIQVALLHDVLEDTKVTESDLINKFGHLVADAVVAMTRVGEENYLFDYIPRVATNRIAMEVKIADLTENLFSIEHFYPSYKHLRSKYQAALEMLSSVLIRERSKA